MNSNRIRSIQVPADDIRVSDLIFAEYDSQTCRYVPTEVVRVRHGVALTKAAIRGSFLEYSVETTRSSGTRMDTAVCFYEHDGLTWPVGAERRRDLDTGAYVPRPAPDLDITRPPDPAMAVGRAELIGENHCVAFEDPFMPGRWIYGNAGPTFITPTGTIEIPVREGNGALRSHLLSPGAPVWVTGTPRTDHKQPKPWRERGNH